MRNLIEMYDELENSENDGSEYKIFLGMGFAEHNIKTLPTFNYSGNMKMEKCSICLCEYSIGETLITLPYFHIFHKTCISAWLGTKTKCPICRNSISLMNFIL